MHLINVGERLERGEAGRRHGERGHPAQFMGQHADGRAGVEEDGLPRTHLTGRPAGDGVLGLVRLAEALPQRGLRVGEQGHGPPVGARQPAFGGEMREVATDGRRGHVEGCCELLHRGQPARGCEPDDLLPPCAGAELARRPQRGRRGLGIGWVHDVPSTDAGADQAFGLGAICAAWRSASTMLPTSTFPVPAMSKAVPWSTEVRMTGSPTLMLTPASMPRTLTGPWPWSWYIATTRS